MKRADIHGDPDPFGPLPSWQELAACGIACGDPADPAHPRWWDVTHPTSPDPSPDNAAAIDVCSGCAVTGECLDHADPKLDRYSIRGGLMPPVWANPSTTPTTGRAA